MSCKLIVDFWLTRGHRFSPNTSFAVVSGSAEGMQADCLQLWQASKDLRS